MSAKVFTIVFIYVLFVSDGVCDLSPLLFPYDNIIGNNNTEIQCPEFEKIANGNVVVQKLSITRKVVATITCDHGYDVDGNGNIHCVDGQWEFYTLPQCVKRCLSPPYLKNGALEIEGEKDEDGYYPKGTLASYSCGEGYELTPVTSNLRVCEKGIWTGPVASCVPTVVQFAGCLTPKNIENGYFVPEKSDEMQGYNSFGQRLHYNCKNGFILVGARVQQCLDDSTWSPRLQPICELKEGK